MNHNKKIGKIKKQFMDFFFKETSEGYNRDTIDSRGHLGINLLCEEYAEEVLSQLNALDKPKYCKCKDVTNIPIDENGRCVECKKIRTKPKIDEGKLREYLWLSHGHYGLYGDDGEMQCSICRLDFKRDSLDKIINRVVQVREKENIDKLSKPNTLYKPKIDERKLRKLLLETDSCLSYLRHRCGIKWEDLKAITVQEVDDLIGRIREEYTKSSKRK